MSGWLLALSAMFSRFIHVAMLHSFLWLNHIFCCVEVPPLLIHSLVGGHLGCFQFKAIMNNAAINIHIQDLWGHMFSILLSISLGVELLGHMITLLNFLRKCQTILHRGFTISPSLQQCTRVPISSHLRQHLSVSYFIFILAIVVCVK